MQPSEPILRPEFMGPPAHVSCINYTTDRLEHFTDYRNEKISRMIVSKN